MPGCGCLRAEGENRPSRPNHVIVEDGVRCLNPWDCQSKRQYSVDGVYRTLDAGNCVGGQAHGVVYPINTMVATRGGKDDMRTCFGIGEPNDPQFTISAAHEHGVCYAVEGNTVDRKSNKNGKGYCEDVSPTLNTQDKHAVTYAIEGNGQRESHQGDGYAETDKMYTLNTIERHAVCFRKSSKPGINRSGERWVEDEKTNTLNTFEFHSEVRTPEVVAIDCRNMQANEELSGTIQAKNQGGHSLNYINPIVYDARGNGGGYDRSDHHGGSSKQSE